MNDREERTIALPAEEAEFVDSLVASGAYSSPTEVVRAGLHALQEREALIDRWLREEVVPVYDAMQREPARALSGEDVLAAIEARHAERLKSRKRGA
jgi:antitoxin ParD1/3/4